MVQLYVSHLRRVLDGNGAGIVTRGRGYELQLSDGDVDAVRFERLVDESRAREALALWRGEPLADVVDEPFAADEIRRLGELRLRAAECAVDADLDAGRYAEVIGELEALVAVEPLREHFRAQHMLALYRAGRQSDALAAFRDARSALVEQIGVEPGAELQRLHEQILAHDPALDLPAAGASEPAASPRAPPRRAPAWLLVGAAVLILAGITTFGVIRVLEPEGLASIDENHVGLINPDGLRITKEIPVGAGPSAAAEGGGSVWIANAADGTVSRIDRTRDEAVRIAVGGAPAAVAFGAGSLWVADSESRDVVQVDPGANKPVGRITVGNAPRALAVTPGALWVASGVDGRIRKIDLRSGHTGSPIRLGANPSALAAGAGALWVASEESGTVTRIDPRTGRVVQPISVGSGASAVAVGEGAVWVVNRQVGTLSRIDPERNAVTWSGAVGSDPTAVAVGEGAVWVAGGEDGTVVQVDPDGPRVVETRKTGSSPAAIVVAGGSVWAAADAPRSAHRGGTLRVLVPSSPKPSLPLDWLDPHAYMGWAAFSLESLAYDGLVAYRRVEGPAGATIVGALATTAPPASHDGLSYVFTLRRGLRYSDGRPVRPADFRASMERFRQATRDLPATCGRRGSTRASSARGDAWTRMVAATCRVGSKRTRGRAPSACI
jgi:DNA-binding beta-propeller fold protein YncE